MRMVFRDRRAEHPKKQERSIDIPGGKRVPFSGSLPHQKGDFEAKEVLVEAKTALTSWAMNAHTVLKLVRQATRVGKRPVFQIELRTLPPRWRKWAIIPWDEYRELTKEE